MARNEADKEPISLLNFCEEDEVLAEDIGRAERGGPVIYISAVLK